MRYRSKFILIFTFLLVLLGHENGFSQTILIDPGHGGKDDGAKAFQAFINKKEGLRKELILKRILFLELSKGLAKN